MHWGRRKHQAGYENGYRYRGAWHITCKLGPLGMIFLNLHVVKISIQYRKLITNAVFLYNHQFNYSYGLKSLNLTTPSPSSGPSESRAAGRVTLSHLEVTRQFIIFALIISLPKDWRKAAWGKLSQASPLAQDQEPTSAGSSLEGPVQVVVVGGWRWRRLSVIRYPGVLGVSLYRGGWCGSVCVCVSVQDKS